jgi:hypothetical protein
MKRTLAPISGKQDKSVKYLREKGISIIKRELIRIREKKNNPVKRFREEERSTMDIQALNDVQNQLDSLIEEMMNAKLTLAGLAIGADEVEACSNANHSHEEHEIE